MWRESKAKERDYQHLIWVMDHRISKWNNPIKNHQVIDKIQQLHQFQFVYTNYYNYCKLRNNRIYCSTMVKYQQHLMYISGLINQAIDLPYINLCNFLINWILMMELISLSTISHKSLDYFFTFHQSTIKHLDSYSSQCLKSLTFTTK